MHINSDDPSLKRLSRFKNFFLKISKCMQPLNLGVWDCILTFIKYYAHLRLVKNVCIIKNNNNTKHNYN